MAFTVEDGTIVDGANSFVDVTYADAYFADRGIAAWTGNTSTVKQPALIRATDYIVQRWQDMLKGDLVDEDQPLPFPRDEEGDLPDTLLRATCEYALRTIDGTPLLPDPTTDETGKSVISKTEEVGPLKESTTYSAGGTVRVFKPYPAADALMRPLLKSSGRVIRN